jgi:hypothetical protein
VPGGTLAYDYLRTLPTQAPEGGAITTINRLAESLPHRPLTPVSLWQERYHSPTTGCQPDLGFGFDLGFVIGLDFGLHFGLDFSFGFDLGLAFWVYASVSFRYRVYRMATSAYRGSITRGTHSQGTKVPWLQGYNCPCIEFTHIGDGERNQSKRAGQVLVSDSLSAV